jgi:hypothetical protein
MGRNSEGCMDIAKALVPSNCTSTHRNMALTGEFRRAFTWGPPGPSCLTHLMYSKSCTFEVI